ncbi:mitochondrial import receptor subunit TOM22-like protein [Leptotrombidium deliense]|uniref:Mitochondrial import receptor subunit TOM22 homolog n=1 Tax=Leptotrombidium deliense TaxID=299467 RepID=A0A443SKL8_9ACAR|nr:mitochondrial import receptor subunit TOM22-like protein [Leptotrombidium deliense]
MDSGVESSSISGHESPSVVPTSTERGDEPLTADISDTGIVNDEPSTQTLFSAETNVNPAVQEDSDDDEDIDETLGERLYGLTEMFPQFIRSGVHKLTLNTLSGLKSFYGFSRSAVWIVFSSSTILIAPVIFEMERSQMQKQLQKQMLLGPGVGMAAPSPGGMMPMPPTPQR